MFEIKLNGSSYNFKGRNISDLIAENNLEEDKLAIELNKVILPREKFTETILESGDVVELVEFVGGG